MLAASAISGDNLPGRWSIMAGTMRLGSELDRSRVAVVLILTFVRVAFFPGRLDVVLFS